MIAQKHADSIGSRFAPSLHRNRLDQREDSGPTRHRNTRLPEPTDQDKLTTSPNTLLPFEPYRTGKRVFEKEPRAITGPRTLPDPSSRRMLSASLVLLCLLMVGLWGVKSGLLRVEMGGGRNDLPSHEETRLSVVRDYIAKTVDKGHEVVRQLETELSQESRALQIVQDPSEVQLQVEAGRAYWMRAEECKKTGKIVVHKALKGRMHDLKTKLDGLQASIDQGVALNRLREERIALSSETINHTTVAQKYQVLFLNAGFDVDGHHPEIIADRICQSPFRAIWLDALGDWALLLWYQEQALSAKIERATFVGRAQERRVRQDIPGFQQTSGSTRRLRLRLMDAARLVAANSWHRKLYDGKVWSEPQQLHRLATRLLNDQSEFSKLSPSTLVLMGTLLDRTDKTVGKQWFRRAVRLHSQDFWVNCELGRVLFRIDLPPTHPDLAEAFGAYRKALGARPESPIAWNNLGKVLSQQEKLGAAVRAYEKAVEFDSQLAVVWSNLGDVLRQQKQLE